MAEDAGQKGHWEAVYAERGADGVSWYQADPSLSLHLIDAADLEPGARVVDVGGGASTLVDHLLERGLAVDVLDLSGTALGLSRARLGVKAGRARWFEADATQWNPEPGAYALWHDRAVFHFLVEPHDRAAYVERLKQGLRPGGQLVLAAFAPDGPEKCSGLPVRRYDAGGVLEALGGGFSLLEEAREEHHTPWDSVQAFSYYRLEWSGRRP